MTNPDNLIEDQITMFCDEVANAEPMLRNAARQIHCWRMLAKTAYSAFQDAYAVCHEGGAKGMPADLMHPDDYKRMKNWKAEVDRCKAEAYRAEEKQP